ncbi:MAG: DUF3515 domain-containing protein [Actinomycetes bacterium]
MRPPLLRRRRPALTSAGAVAVVLLLASGCGGGAVEVDAPAPTGRAASACTALMKELPSAVADQKRRDVSPASASAAAWGDPPIVLRCGVGRPRGFNRFSTCQVTNGVGWFIPDSQITGSATAITMTTIGRAAYVEVRLPADYFPPAAAMADLAPAIKKAVPLLRTCV